MPPVVAALRQVTDDFEIVVVDDGSRDRTAEVVRELSQRYPEVRLVQHPVNLGYGAAVWTGITSGQKEFIFYTDADGQFDITELRRFIPVHRRVRHDHRLPRPARRPAASGWSSRSAGRCS